MMMNLIVIFDGKKYQIVDNVAGLSCEYAGFIQYNLPTTYGLMLMNIDLWTNHNNNYAVVNGVHSI